jgi:DNA mismatch endonuclease, patch repair protein
LRYQDIEKNVDLNCPRSGDTEHTLWFPDPLEKSMFAVPSKNTKPELGVQQFARDLGIRFETHREDLPGCPDLVFPTLCTVVMYRRFRAWILLALADHMPPPATEYWRKKLWYSKKRDERNITALERQGWKVVVIWECEDARLTLSAAVIS